MSISAQRRFLAILATGRFANLPTVWTNVLVGGLLAYPWGVASGGMDELVPAPFILVAVLGSCFYVGGCFLGDARDARWDAENRPDRPIPQNVLSAGAVALAGYTLIALGCIGGCFFDIVLGAINVGLVSTFESLRHWTIDDLSFSIYAVSYQQLVLSAFLALSIILYATLHKRVGRGAPILMSLCRGLLVLWAATLINTWFAGSHPSTLSATLLIAVLPYALCVTVYTIVLSMVARNESNPDAKLPPRLLQVLYILPPVGTVGVLLFTWIPAPATGMISIAVAVVAFVAWSGKSLVTLRRSIPAFVAQALAGFSLVDACFAALVAWEVVAFCLASFLLALLLQRIAPAT